MAKGSGGGGAGGGRRRRSRLLNNVGSLSNSQLRRAARRLGQGTPGGRTTGPFFRVRDEIRRRSLRGEFN